MAGFFLFQNINQTFYSKYKKITGGKLKNKVLIMFEIYARNLFTFFEYEDQVRKIIYNQKYDRGMHRQIRKIIKFKGAFSSDHALMKLIYLIIKNITKKMDDANA